MDLQGPEKFPTKFQSIHYYHFIILIAVYVQILPLIIFSDSRDPIFNSRDLNRVSETP